jgi:hypothetical protein
LMASDNHLLALKQGMMMDTSGNIVLENYLLLFFI